MKLFLALDKTKFHSNKGFFFWLMCFSNSKNMSPFFLHLIQIFESCIVHPLLYEVLNFFQIKICYFELPKSRSCRSVLNNNLCYDKQKRGLILILSWAWRTEMNPSMGIGLIHHCIPCIKTSQCFAFCISWAGVNVPPVPSAKQIFNSSHVKLHLQNISSVKHKVCSPESQPVCADLFTAGRILQLCGADHVQKIPL